ncbi:type VII secretion protein EccB [Gordonia sp. VNK21]|uniref:type VII secretion protein EccB n=1 Tax=Gordonia sp. VNK21 TaxID=3382483 RepID=UPI0038D35DEE
MSRQFTTRAQVSGYRFGLARAEHALVRRDARMLHDPLRSQWRALMAGAVIALLVTAGAGLYGVIRPQPTVGDARLVVADSGALYVLDDGVVHPVPNLASARLVLGEPAVPQRVSQRSLDAYPRGAALGVAGAPARLPAGGPAGWTVCDDPAAGTAVLAGRPQVSRPRPGDAALVSTAGQIWLLYRMPADAEAGGGETVVRARVDPAETAVLRALHLEQTPVRPVSAALLNTVPAQAPLTLPGIDGRGRPGPGGLAGHPVGSVVATLGVDDAPSYFVVLADGVQPVGAVAADALRRAADTPQVQVPRLAPGTLTALPVRHRLPLDSFPAAIPQPAGPGEVLCWSRLPSAGGGTDDRLIVAGSIPVPDGGAVRRLVSADGGGPGLDGLYLRPGSGYRVRSGGEHFIGDDGVRYRLTGADTAAVLGLAEVPQEAPWPVISLLPAGPALSREAALTARDAPG